MIESSKLPDECKKIYPNGVDLHMNYEVSDDGVMFSAFEDGNVTVDKLLDHTDVSLEWYIPSDDAIKFMVFIRLVLGEEPENSNPKAHYFFIDCILQSPNVIPFFMVRGIDFNELAGETVVLCSREFSKSTLVTYLILYMAVEGKLPNFGKINYGLYVSDSMRNGVKKMMDRIKGVYYESKYLQSMFEEVNFTQEEVIFVRKPRTRKEIETFRHTVEVEKKDKKYVHGRMKRTFKIDGLGCQTSSRGASNVLTRPQFVFVDDVVANEKDASSKTILDSIESTIESDIRGGLSGTGYFLVAIGTPFTKNDPIYRRIEEGLMLPVVFPRAEAVPATGVTEKQFKSVWPDRHTFKNCRREYRNAKKASDDGNPTKMRKLMQEHYLRISSEEDRMIPDSMIETYRRSDIEKNLSGYNIVITTDFTTTDAAGSDLSGVAAWAVSSNSDYLLLDLALRKMSIGEQYDEVFRMVQYWGRLNGRGVDVGIETDGQQKAHIFALKEMMIKRNVWFNIGRQKGAKYGVEGIQSSKVGGDKHWRFRLALPIFHNRKIKFPEELMDTFQMKELLEEIKYATYDGFGSKYDDGVDLISMLIVMNILTPSKYMDSGLANSKDPKIWGKQSYDDEPNAYESYI